MEKAFEYFGFHVHIKARHPTTEKGKDLWLSTVRYRFGPPDDADLWATLDRGMQKGYADPQSAIREATAEVCAFLDPKIEAIRQGSI